MCTSEKVRYAYMNIIWGKEHIIMPLIVKRLNKHWVRLMFNVDGFKIPYYLKLNFTRITETLGISIIILLFLPTKT